MTLKRSLSLLLATLMLTSTLAACAADTESPTDTAPGGTTVYVDALDNFHHGFREIIAGRVNTATSIYKSKQKATEEMVKQFNAKLTRLINNNK